MNTSDRNLELLSAYLDGELSGRDREHLERQLQKDEVLQSRYEELKRTRLMLRSIPQLRAPRNFLLTPGMVGQKGKSSRAFPVLRFASAFAALLLVLLFLGDLFVIPNPGPAPMMSAEIVESVQLEEERAVAEADTFASQAPAAEEPLLEAAPYEQPAPAAPMEGEPAAEAEAEEDENISAFMKTDQGTQEKLPLPTEKIDSPEELLAGATGPATEGALGDGEFAAEIMLDDESGITQFPRWIVPIAELALLFIAITTGLAAYFLYRRR